MSCNIQLNTNGKILSVNADNGEKSLLFATLSSLPFLSKEQASELYLLAKKQATKNTIKDVNGEPQIVFQPLGGEHEYLLTDKMVTYTDFYKALSLDASERGVRFGILTAKNVEEFNPTNSLEHKKLVEIAKKADSTNTTISTNNTYISDNPKDFTLIDKFDRATNTNSKDGFLASLINLGIKIKPKQKTGIHLAIERNNGNPLNLAPNGKPSILFQSYKDLGYSNEKSEELVAKTYSDEFLAWFGDWLNNPERASKVVDENGQPLVVFHNTDVDFTDYVFQEKGKNNSFGGSVGKGIYTSTKEQAERYKGKYTKPLFLNIQTPLVSTTPYSKQSINLAIKLVNDVIDNSDHPNKEYAKRNAEFDIKDKMPKGVTPYVSGYFTSDIITKVNIQNGFDGVFDGGLDKVAFDPNQIKSATENSGDFSLENNDIRFQIIGEQGASKLKNARTVLKNLQVAKKMRVGSKDERTIKITTGWEFNEGDNKWKREVDSKSIYKNVAIPKGYNFLFKKQAIPLEEFFKNKELFRLYPQLKEYKVYINPSTNSKVLGAVSTERKEIMLPFSGKELKTTLIHEIQHIIQDIEGFAVGGSPEMFEGLSDNKQKIYKQITTKISRIFQNKNDDWRKAVKPFMIEYLDSGQELYTENIEKLEDFNTLLSLLEEYREVIYSGNNKYFLTPEQQYNNLAGEVEARNAAFRMDMTVEEKLKSLLSDTQDVKEEDKIYIQEELKEALRLESQASTNNSQELLEGVYEQLKKAKVVDNTYFLSNQEIEDKLREWGYSEDIVKQVSAWHGSPYSFDRFEFSDRTFLTGEKAAAFGAGLYFTDLEGIARNYAKDLTNKQLNLNKISVKLDGVDVNEFKGRGFVSEGQIALQIKTAIYDFDGDLDKIKNYFSDLENKYKRFDNKDITDSQGKKWLETYRDILNILNNVKNIEYAKPRNLYKVSLHKGKTPSEYTWLEWDKELNQEQIRSILDNDVSGEIAEALNYYYSENNDISTTKDLIDTMYNDSVNGKKLYNILSKNIGENPNAKDASLALLSAGIDGVKYPAESISRGATSDTARGFNYVVFDENAITIEEQIQFQIIGEKGSNNVIQEKELLDEAKYLKENNVPIEEIENKTGWLFIDNQWKKLSTALINKFSLKQEAYEKINESQKLSDVLEDQSIFDYYPTLKAVEIIFYDKEFKLEGKTDILQSKNTLGHFDEFTGENGTLFVKATSKENKLGVTAHELSHKIQQIEGFPEGGNLYTLPNEVKRLIKSSATDVVQLVKDIGNADLSKFSGQELKLIKDTEFALKYLAGSKDEYYLNTMYELLVGEVDATIVENLVKNEENIIGNLSYFYKSFLSSKYKTPSDMYVLRGVSEGNQANVKVTTNGFLVKEEKSTKDILRFLTDNNKIEKIC